MAELDPNTATLQDVLDNYNEDPTRLSKKTGKMPNKRTLGPVLKEYANTPIIELFEQDENGVSKIKGIIRKANDAVLGNTLAESTLKNAMQTTRYLSVQFAKKGYEGNPPSFLLTENSPKAAEVYFGTKEPAKAVSKLQVNHSQEARVKFIEGLLDWTAKNPDKKHITRTILFHMNTGLRPSAVTGLDVGSYNPDTGSIYLAGDVEGAKGNPVNVGLNNMADSMVQQQLRESKNAIGTSGKIFVSPDGKPVTNNDINKVLSEIKVPNLLYDAEKKVYYDSFKPEGAGAGKFGLSLMRNWHTAIGRGIGVNDLVLAKLQGRSTKSYGKGSTGEMSTYDTSFPHIVTDYEREQANMLHNTFLDDAEKAMQNLQQRGITKETLALDMGSEADIVKERITKATPDYAADQYWDRPAIEGESTVVSRETQQAAIEQKVKLEPEEKKSILNKFKNMMTGGGGKLLKAAGPVGVGVAATLKIEEAQAEIEGGAPVLPTAVGKAAEFAYEEFTPMGLAEQVGGMLGDVQPATEEEALQDPEAFTESDVGIIRQQQMKDKLEKADKLQNFLSEDLIQP